jgi:hypothetical protein
MSRAGRQGKSWRRAATPSVFGSPVLAAILGMGLLASLGTTLQGGNLYVPNYSFESPAVPPVSPYAMPGVDSWQKSPQPAWYDPAQNDDTPWEDLTGTFYNVPFPGEFIGNCDGNQAAFVFALPDVALFQDYNSVSGTNTAPSHAFNARFNPARSYTLTVGLIGGGGNMAPGATFQISLYYRDASNNVVAVAATTVTNTVAAFPDTTNFVDYQVHLPTVQPSDPWAGQNIGVQLASTVDLSLASGYWDVDNVRLVEGIDVPNYSFESPTVPPVSPYAAPDIDYWEKSSQPAWYDPTQNDDTPWDDLMGEFYNVPFPGEFIDNCDGHQAAFMFALPGVGLFQDFNSFSGTNAPTHALSAAFTAGKAYSLTVGLIGGGGGMTNGATFQVGLYYRDASNNVVTVAAATVTNTPALFPNTTNLVDCQVQMPGVKITDAWAGRHIGIQLLSTVGFDLAGGYWDLDNVRLAETVAPALANAGVTNGQTSFTLLSEPGLAFEIETATDLAPGTNQWVSIGTLTNVTGTGSFAVPVTSAPQRFYRAHQL